MNETAINNAIRKLEEMTDLLRKISKKEITQKSSVLSRISAYRSSRDAL